MFHRHDKGFLNFSPFKSSLSCHKKWKKMRPCIGVAAKGVEWGSCLGAPNRNCESWVFVIKIKYFMFIKVSYTFLDSNPIFHKCFCSGIFSSGGDRGAIFTSFPICQDYILRAFFFLQGQHCWGLVEYRRNVKETNIIILELRNTTFLT